MSAPTRAAVPATSAIDEARPGPIPTMPSTSTGMYGRVIWVARNASPKMAKIRRTTGSDRTPLTAPNASDSDRTLRDDRRPDLLRPERHEQGGADRQQGGHGEDGRERPAEAVDDEAAEGRADGEPDRSGGAEDRDGDAQAPERRDVADPGQHHARCSRAGSR